MIDILKEECGGERSTDFRREYCCEVIVNTESAVIPEFSLDLQSEIIKEWERPPFFDAYVGMDIGMRDLTAIIFGYYDFKSAKLILEDELVFGGQKSSQIQGFNPKKGNFNTEVLARDLKEKETALWSNPLTQEEPKVYKRVCDNNNLILVNDLWQLHRILFEPVSKKEDFEAGVNQLRIWLQSGRIVINPKCENVIRHLRDATWQKNKKELSRSVDKGHFDFVPALVYLVRMLDTYNNPYPPGYGVGNTSNMWGYKQKDPLVNQVVKTMMNIKPKRR
jgi:hypothetical protein